MTIGTIVYNPLSCKCFIINKKKKILAFLKIAFYIYIQIIRNNINNLI